jgi:hypothetical protein
MHTAFGKAGALRQAPDALFAVCTNRVDNANALGPQSHGVGPCSEGWLTLETSALQSTRSTTGCPALGGYPETGNIAEQRVRVVDGQGVVHRFRRLQVK